MEKKETNPPRLLARAEKVQGGRAAAADGFAHGEIQKHAV